MDNIVWIGDHCRLTDTIFAISGSHNRIVIRNGVNLNEVTLHTENDGNEIRIEAATTFHGKTDISAIEGTRVHIGADCMFSREIYLSTGDGHSVVNAEGIRTNQSRDIEIGDHVWVGTKSVIGKGVVIGNHCIVAAGAVMAKQGGEREEGVCYAGNPAKVVKRKIGWLRERI